MSLTNATMTGRAFIFLTALTLQCSESPSGPGRGHNDFQEQFLCVQHLVSNMNPTEHDSKEKDEVGLELPEFPHNF